MSNDFYDEKGPIDLTDKEQADFWERQTKGMSKALSESRAIVRAKSEQIKALEAKNVELESYKKDWQEIAGRANLKHLVNQNAELENRLACSVDSEAYLTLKFATDSTTKELEKKLQVAVEIIKELQAMEGVPHLDDHFEFLKKISSLKTLN